jgi:hypothetical protein
MNRYIGSLLVLGFFAIAALIGCASMYDDGSKSGDGGFLDNGHTGSFFEAIQVDPKAEDSAGPQFVALGDFNADGWTDIVSGWNESQPIAIHLQQRTDDGDVYFATLPVGGTTPIARISGLKVADLDQDGFDDIAVLVKDTGMVAMCDQERPDCDVTENGGIIEDAIAGAIVLFFNPGNVFTEPWEAFTLSQSQLAGTDEAGPPEIGGYSGFDVADIDGQNGPDLIVAHNSPEGEPPVIDPPPSSIKMFVNPGGVNARNGGNWARTLVYGDLPAVSACRAADVDGDGDVDIVATFPEAKSANVRWLPNPRSLGPIADVYKTWPYYAPIGQVATEANVIELGDVDGDGLDDVLVRSTLGKIVQWFKKPSSPSQQFIRNPWQVYSIAEFGDRAPGAIALGDLTGTGQLDVAVAAGGAVAFFQPYAGGDDVYEFWQENVIIDDDPAGSTTDTSGLPSVSTDPNATGQDTAGTFINNIIVADIDEDGRMDIIATLDRTADSGLSNDAIVFFHNVRITGDSTAAAAE